MWGNEERPGEKIEERKLTNIRSRGNRSTKRNEGRVRERKERIGVQNGMKEERGMRKIKKQEQEQ